MCKIGGIAGALVALNAYLVAAIALVAGAIVANGSFWGALSGTAVVLMLLALAATLAAETTLLWVRSEVKSFLTCIYITTGKPFPKCTDYWDTFSRLIGQLLVILAAAAVAFGVLIPLSYIPWVPLVGMIALSLSLAAALVNLVGLDIAIANLIDCVRKEAELAKKPSDLKVADLDVLTCPMNKSVCQDNDLRLAGQFASGSYSTTASFAVVLSAGSVAIKSVTADITDSFGNSSNSLGILQPNQHAIHDPAAWAIRGDWSVLSNDIRVEALPKNMWTLDLEMKMANRKTVKHSVTLMINN